MKVKRVTAFLRSAYFKDGEKDRTALSKPSHLLAEKAWDKYVVVSSSSLSSRKCEQFYTTKSCLPVHHKQT